MDAMKVIEENPGIAIGAVVLLVLVLLLKGGASSAPSTSDMINAQLVSQKQAGATDVALAGINANAATARTQALANVYTTQITTSAQLAAANSGNNVALQLGMAQNQTNQQSLADQVSLGQQQIASNQAIAGQALAVQSQQIQDNADLAHYQIAQNSANLPGIEQYQLNMAQTQAGSAALVAQTNGQTAQAIASITAANNPALINAQTAASTASSNSSMGWVGAVASIAALFM